MSYATKTLFSISSDTSIIGILIPNVLTIILISRNQKKLKGNKKWLKIICTVVFIWIILIAAKFGLVEARSGFYTIYYVIVAFIQVRIFGKKLYLYYEDIMVIMAKITLVMWFMGVILPPIDQIYTMFPLSIESDNRTMDGYNILYIFCWNHNPNALFPRNAGFSWEPGRYAIMLALAIMVNLYRQGINFRSNPGIFWLIISLVSTQSTTGFSIVLVLYLYFGMKKFRIKHILSSVAVAIPLIYAASQTNFIGGKIKKQIEDLDSTESVIRKLQWNDNNNVQYRTSLDRFMSIYFELLNISQEPITGYGPTTNKSYFSNLVENASLTGGILKLIGKYGIPLGLFFYFILFNSSIYTARLFGSRKNWGLFTYTLMSSVSYDMFCVALFMSFWFIGVFNKDRPEDTRKHKLDLKKRKLLKFNDIISDVDKYALRKITF